MKKGLRFLAIYFFIYPAVITSSFAEEVKWEDKTKGIDKEIRTVAVDPQDAKVVYVGSNKAIFKTVDGGENWQKVKDIRGVDKVVNFLSIDPRNSRIVYAATENGLLRSRDEGRSWERIFRGLDEEEKNCLAIAVSSRGIYLGTKRGLFQSYDEGKTWFKAGGELGDTVIITIIVHPLKANVVYALTFKGVYRTDDAGKTWERVYISSPQDVEDIDEEETDSEGAENQTSNLSHLAIDSQEPEKLFLGSSEGLLMSTDSGKSWQRLSDTGLLNRDVQFILFSPQNNQLYVATKRGIFQLSGQDKWEELFVGITCREVYFLTLDSERNLWAGTENGVFKTVSEEKIIKEEMVTKEFIDYFKDEPTVQEIQRVATRYAEVQPEKIESWRKGAKYRWLLPQFSLGYDKTVSVSTNPSYKESVIGPVGWNMDFTWDLADLIWNPYQKDIDVRSRLMVQLRDDILDEVTRLYFERRRLQTEMFLSPPVDTKLRWEKQLRLEELTASIDALTGGYLSRSLSEK